MDDGSVGTAVVWWEEAHDQEPWGEAGETAGLDPIIRDEYTTSEKNERVFDAEVLAIHRALRAFDERNETGAQNSLYRLNHTMDPDPSL